MSGPGGSLWFSEDIANIGDKGEPYSNIYKIGKITPSGVISEFPIPVPAELTDDALDGMTSGPDGNLWFDLNMASNETVTNSTGWAASTLCEIGRVSSSGAITEFPVPNTLPAGLIPICELTDITSGRDGNLWFGLTINEINKTNGYLISTLCEIGRITPAGAITEFPVPNNYEISTELTYDELDNITSGHDGNLWFDLMRIAVNSTGEGFYAGGTIERITPSGAITTFPMLGYEDGVDTLTLPWPDMIPGPDGNIWFTDAFFKIDPVSGRPFPVEKIGRITPAGVITEYSLPNNDGAGEIKFGPDGNLWFTLTDNIAKDQIGQITPAGIVTEFPVSNAYNFIQGFTFGPDGNLWFQDEIGENSNAVIGRFLLQ